MFPAQLRSGKSPRSNRTPEPPPRWTTRPLAIGSSYLLQQMAATAVSLQDGRLASRTAGAGESSPFGLRPPLVGCIWGEMDVLPTWLKRCVPPPADFGLLSCHQAGKQPPCKLTSSGGQSKGDAAAPSGSVAPPSAQLGGHMLTSSFRSDPGAFIGGLMMAFAAGHSSPESRPIWA